MTRKEHLFLKLVEECAEVQQRVSKLLQFGEHEIQTGQAADNISRLHAEVKDLVAVLILLEEYGLPSIALATAPENVAAKRERIEKYLQLSMQRGLVHS